MKTKGYLWPVVTGIIFIGFFVATTVYYYRATLTYNDEIIAQNIEQLKDIFIRINDTCKIQGFEHDIDNIDFLNTVSFVGNQVGPMILTYPQFWKGPYLEKNIEIQGKPYQVVKTQKGYYIVPGEGVKLYNGKILGLTIKISPSTDIDMLIKDPETLLSKEGKPLAAKLPTTKSGFDLMAPLSIYDTPVDVY